MTPFGTCPTKPNELCLHVTEYLCRCSNRWTHSYPLLYGNGHYGGTPNPHEERTFPLTRVTTTSRTTLHCFRCIPVGTPRGWDAGPPRPAPKSVSLSSIEDSILS